ncbi:cytochrome P450 [Sporodiniella umbellata]|nr:cytochrome P450 [Sporodiniella umbellata]
MFYLWPVSLTLVSIYFLTRKRFEKKKGIKEIPYPSSISWPIFGIYSPIRKLNQWHTELVVVKDPKIAHEILVKNGKDISTRPYHRFLSEMYSKNESGVIFGRYSHAWKKKRAFISSLLKPASVDALCSLTSFEAKETMKRFTEAAKSGRSFNPSSNLGLYTMNTIMGITFGKRFDSIEDPGFITIRSMVDRFITFSGTTGDIATFFPQLFWINYLIKAKKKLEAVTGYINSVRIGLLQEALKSEKVSLAKDLYKIKEETSVFTEEDIQVMTSGSDTVSVALYWALVIISNYPDVQEKLIAELNNWKSKNPTRDTPSFTQDREDFLYSICVQREVLRFRPPAPNGTVRVCTKDLVIGQYVIPKGTNIVAHLLAMNFDTDTYDDPEAFRPERFIKNTQKMSASANNNIEERDQFAFGWGRRLCPGIYLAEIEMFNFFAQFFSKFTVHPENDVGDSVSKMDYFEDGSEIKPMAKNIRCKLRI